MLRFDPETVQGRRWKMFGVLCHNGVTATDDGCRKNVPIALVRERQGRDQDFVSGNEAIPNVCVHKIARAFQPSSIAVRLITQ